MTLHYQASFIEQKFHSLRRRLLYISDCQQVPMYGHTK